MSVEWGKVRCSTLAGSCIGCKKLDLPKRCVANERSSLFCQSNNKEEKGFITLSPGAHVIKPYKTKVRAPLWWAPTLLTEIRLA
jgi:hypothetical protein